MRRRSRKKLSTREGIVIATIPFLIGMIILGFGLRNLIQAYASRHWPSVPGTVTSSKVVRHRGTGTGKSKSKDSFWAEVWYSYTVNEKTLSGNRVLYGDYGSSDRSHAQRLVRRYPVGKEVSVHYSPKQPAKCVLEPGAKISTWVIPLSGTAFVLLGCGMAFWVLRAARRRSAAAEPSGVTE
jgi:hypothetical protein